MNDEIKEIREYISCPQFGDDHYGEWGALKLEQRIKIKSLLDYITNLQQENKRLKLKYKSQKDINQKLLSIDIKHKKINGELRKENSKLEIALQNIQEDYDKRVEENKRLKENAIHNDKVVDKAKWNEMIYKSRCEKINKILKETPDFNYSYDYTILKRRIENILQNGSEENE